MLVHDLRRSAVRNMERAGLSGSVAMQLTGHKTEAVYRRYAITSEADLREAVDRLNSRPVNRRVGWTASPPLKAGALGARTGCPVDQRIKVSASQRLNLGILGASSNLSKVTLTPEKCLVSCRLFGARNRTPCNYLHSWAS